MMDLLIEKQVPVALGNLLDKQTYPKLKQANIKIICHLPNLNLPGTLQAQNLGAAHNKQFFTLTSYNTLLV